MSQAFKADAGKLRMSLLPPKPIEDIVRGLEFGAKKYAPNAWRTGLAWSRVLDACERHILAWKKGEDLNSESGLNHLAHAACNLIFLLEYADTCPQLDDRYTLENSQRTLHDVLDGPCMCGATHTGVK